MTTTATKSVISPNQTVTITAQGASPKSVTIPSQGVVQFTADAQNDYLLQFFDRYNDRHVAVNIFLPANGSVYVVGGNTKDDQNATCYYNSMTYSGGLKPIDTGGGNKIIIGSGSNE